MMELELGSSKTLQDETNYPKAQPLQVDWDGPDDPANPRNWSTQKQMCQIIIVSGFTLYSNLAATMFAPGADALCAEFGITSTTLAALTVSIYILGFGFGPLLLAPLSELHGRLMIYHVANVFYIGFTIGCAQSTGTAEFLVFRFICGCCASASLAIGGGTIADMIPNERRGKAMAIFGMGPLLGPVVGPIVGGFVTQHIGWRWTFYLILILAGIFTIVGINFLRETNAPVLLRRKAARIQKETGNVINAQEVDSRRVLVQSLIRPTKMLFLSPIVLLFSLYTAFVSGLIFLLFTTFPSVFEKTYGFSTQLSGLAYLGLGLGFFLGVIIFGRMSDRLMKRREGEVHARPELRLPLMIWFSWLLPVGFFWYGWSADRGAHWIVPILGTFFLGVGAFFIMLPIQSYFIDCFGAEGAASALAANLVLRNLCGAFLPLAGPPLYSRLGLGWGNSLLGFIGVAFAPVPVLFFRYGEYLRKRFPVKL